MSEEKAFKEALAEYHEAQVEYTPTRAPRGRVVHATSLQRPGRTCCGKPSDGWIAVAQRLGCRTCFAAVHFDVRPRRKRKRRSKRRAR